MKRFIEGADRSQSTLLPECVDDWVGESNPVRAVDAFVDALDLAELGFKDVEPAATGRPGYHPVLSENHIRTYSWWTPPRTGTAMMLPNRCTDRRSGASFRKVRCGRVRL